MADRASRRAEQQAKLSTMSFGRRAGMVVAGTLAAIAAAAVVNLLITGEVGVVAAVVIGLAAGLGLAYQYLWAPSRRAPRD